MESRPISIPSATSAPIRYCLAGSGSRCTSNSRVISSVSKMYFIPIPSSLYIFTGTEKRLGGFSRYLDSDIKTNSFNDSKLNTDLPVETNASCQWKDTPDETSSNRPDTAYLYRFFSTVNSLGSLQIQVGYLFRCHKTPYALKASSPFSTVSFLRSQTILKPKLLLFRFERFR